MVTRFTFSFKFDGHRRNYSVSCLSKNDYVLSYSWVVLGVFDSLSEALMALVADFNVRFGDYEQGVISSV